MEIYRTRDASTEVKPHEYLRKVSKTTQTVLLQVKKVPSEEIGISDKLVASVANLCEDFAVRVEELRLEEIQAVDTAVIEADGSFDFPFLLKPLQEFLEEVLDAGFIRYGL